MCRKPRVLSNSQIYHIVLRGVNRQNIFEEDEDKITFLKKLLKLKIEVKFEVYGYCIMDNHVHLLIKEGDQSISKIVQRLAISYVKWFNRKYDRCGHLFQGRFTSEPVDDRAYFLTVLRYIHQNPIKANLCKISLDYSWSSIHDYLGKCGIVDISYALNFFSNSIQDFMYFMKYNEKVNCLEIETPRWISDRKALSLILKCVNVTSPFEIQAFPTLLRNNTIKQIHNIIGITSRQISRITGLSLSVVLREKPMGVLGCT